VTALGESGVAMSSDSGSTPLASTTNLLRADVAQLAEHFTRNEGVGGSNPSISTIGIYYGKLWASGQHFKTLCFPKPTEFQPIGLKFGSFIFQLIWVGF
jgi:hypothetical protein